LAPSSPSTPRAEYQSRLEARRAGAASLERRHYRLGNLRLLAFVAGAALAWLAFGSKVASPYWLAVPGVLFAILVILHDGVLRELQAARRAVSYYERLLARLDDRWVGTGEPGDRYLRPDHPYAEDLDLFGRGSLFELLCTARTRAGEATLADWLQSAAPPELVRQRQQAIAELRFRLDLREDLAVLGESVRSGVHAEEMVAWGAASPVFHSPRARPGLLCLSLATVASAILWIWLGWRDLFLILLITQLTIMYRLRHKLARAIADVEQPAHDLALLAGVLARLEQEQFTSAYLAGLRKRLSTPGRPLSLRIRQLNRWIELLDSRDNLFVRVAEPVLLWTVQICFAVEAWRARWGPAIGGWMAALGEIEALSSLAEYTYEHPGDPFPEFVSESPCLAGEGLSHPLLPAARAVANDVQLCGECRVLVVSGSNMSGKSTLLRTVGVNVVLAQAGAPVRARRLRLSSLHPGASIRVLDSLQSGSSRFHAELLHLRRIVTLAEQSPPVLFLLDEFLHGTNSHDRRIGAEAIVRGLITRGAIGLITTHDLALADIADALAPRAANVHFEDHLENGRMSFDYRMRPGIVTKSNALELMRSMGLEV
jgi:hypothetical protein